MQYIVGDIHGEVTKLNSLITAINLTDKNPEFIFIGDYIDKGENSNETLIFLTAFEKKAPCTFLYGNHEYQWLTMNKDDNDIQNYLMKYGGLSTIHSLEAKGIWEARQILIDRFSTFFSNLKPYWKNDSYVVVHSGIRPQDYSTPIEQIPLSQVLFNRYDFLKQEGFYLEKYKVVFGHTGFYSPFVDAYKIGIDTGACFLKDQPLTAFCIDLSEFIDSLGHNYKLSEVLLDRCPNIPRIKPWQEENGS